VKDYFFLWAEFMELVVTNSRRAAGCRPYDTALTLILKYWPH